MYIHEYVEKLKSIALSINNDDVKKIVLDLLENPRLSFASNKPLIQVEVSPAAPRKHHMFTGGLFVHTYSVAKIALTLCNIFEEIYGIPINKDLVIAASILHDIFKYYQYTIDDKEGGYKARDDWYLSHDYAIVAELALRGAKDDLIRVVSEVHGIAPIKTFEGLIVHLADTIDARFGEYIQNNAISLLKELEDYDIKPYAILDEIIKSEGPKVLGFLAKDRDIFIDIVRNKIMKVLE
ncbi:MAG: HD domain-containing protein [Ignisphaera sp.]|uniref:HD domain-containing protein n=1 Tax=Ignisphaera aggregans TaxID=334771 RepID=A0A7C4JIS0_9CREN